MCKRKIFDDELADAPTPRAPPHRVDGNKPRSMNILHIVLEDFSTLASPAFLGGGATSASDAARRAHPRAGGTTRHPSTPNLERLAARGVTFTRAYCQAPICNPSRSSFMTGRRPNVTRVLTNDDPFRTMAPPGLPTLVDLLRAHAPSASIACASGSKLFHVACDKDAMGFDVERVALPPQIPPAVDEAAAFILRPPGPYSADQHRARLALARLISYDSGEQRGQQFYLGVGLVETHAFEQRVCHVDVVPHAERKRRPSASELEAPPSRGKERLPPLVTHPNFDFWKPVTTEAEQRRAIGLYYGCASHVDGTIGALVGALSAMPTLAKTTAILVQGDHGYSLGQHGRWSKYNAYEDAVRVPLLMAVPGGASGVVVEEVVESLDVLPTILDLWGVPRVKARDHGGGGSTYAFNNKAAPALLDGRSLRHHLYDYDASSTTLTRGGSRPRPPPARSYARTELHLPCGLGCSMLNQPYDGLPPGYTTTPRVGPIVHLRLRSKRWAFTATFRGALLAKENAPKAAPLRLVDEALFDMQADPFEAANLAYYPAFATVRWRLLQRVLREWEPLHVDGPLNQTRWQRAEWLRRLTGARRNWWK